MKARGVEPITDELERPSIEEWLADLDKDPPVALPKPASAYVRAARREAGLEDRSSYPQ